MAESLDLDSLLQSLREVEEQLETIPNGDADRIELRERQRELRKIAATMRSNARSSAELQRDLRRLRQIRDDLLEGHISVGHVGGGNGPGGGGIEPRDVFAMNEAIDAAWDRAGLERRIRDLEAEVQSRGST